MKLIEQSVDVWGEAPLDFSDSLEWIERAGRTCYNSLDKISPGSARPFVERLLRPVPAHLSVIEHSNMVFRSKTEKNPSSLREELESAIKSKFIYTTTHKERVYIYGNYRAFFEEASRSKVGFGFFDLPGLKLIHMKERVYDSKRLPDEARAITIQFTIDRSCSHEMVRHRPVAISQSSQRYIRYQNIEFIRPFWFDRAEKDAVNDVVRHFTECETLYKDLITTGYKPQEARKVLPNATATTLVMTAYLPEWHHIFYLRCSKAADPTIREVMLIARDKVEELTGVKTPEMSPLLVS